jgi:arylsulfatase
VHWPNGPVDRGGIRHQFAHAIDVMPTILDLVGVEVPETINYVPQTEVDGIGFGYLLGQGGGETPGQHLTQHFEMFGSRAIYHDGWKAVTFHPVGPIYGDGLNPNAPFDDDVWELYRVADDVSETRDLAAEHPEKLAELIELWWHEAERNQVLPLDNRVLWALVHPKPDERIRRDRFEYFAFGAQVPEPVAANVRNRSHALVVDVVVPEGVVPDGTLLALGSGLGGWSLHFKDGRVRYIHNLYAKEQHVLWSDSIVGPGAHRVEYEFTKDEGLGGPGVLRVDAQVVAEGMISRFTPGGFNGVGVGLTCGYEWGPAIGGDYEAPFRCNVDIERAVVETRGPVVRDPIAEIERILSEQ